MPRAVTSVTTDPVATGRGARGSLDAFSSSTSSLASTSSASAAVDAAAGTVALLHHGTRVQEPHPRTTKALVVD